MLLRYKVIFIFSFFSALFLLTSTAQAQITNLQEHDFRRYHFGFFVAANQMDFSLKTNEELIGKAYAPDDYTDFVGLDSVQFFGVHGIPHTGFTVGIIGNLKLFEYLDFRFVPSLAFGERTLNYSIRQFEDEVDPEMVNLKKNIVSTHVDLPFFVKYQSKRVNNFRAYILGGIKFSLDLAANSDRNKQETGDFLRLRKTDILIESGVGVNYYFFFFKFGIELKVAYGINNLMVSEDNIFADGVKSIRSKIFQLSLTFE
jgi:hypothetical protein